MMHHLVEDEEQGKDWVLRHPRRWDRTPNMDKWLVRFTDGDFIDADGAKIAAFTQFDFREQAESALLKWLILSATEGA